jgi:hypothetical protein
MQAILDAWESIAENGNVSPEVLRYVRVLERITRRRSFFATKGGRVGLGPANIKVDDKVVVCPTPYLIREGKSQFQDGGGDIRPRIGVRRSTRHA